LCSPQPILNANLNLLYPSFFDLFIIQIGIEG
jgi:hypothetical protein